MRRIGQTGLVLFALLSAFVAGAIVHKKLSTAKLLTAPELVRIPLNYVTSLGTVPDRLVIDIKHNDFQKIAYNRHVALESGVLLAEHRDEVPATITFEGTTYRAKLRLKGDMWDHWRHKDKWSFRVRMSGGETLFGMKRFSLQHPNTRNYIYEWLFHEAVAREGLIKLRYKFVDVVVNGKGWGICALEEAFDKRLIENNQRREGPILKFDESNMWKEFHSVGFHMDKARQGAGTEQAHPVDVFQKTTVMNDSVLFGHYKIAMNLLERFRLGELQAAEVFDVESMARYVALCDLFGTKHPVQTYNVRMYYNPVTSLLEPVPFDAVGGNRLVQIAVTAADPRNTDLAFIIVRQLFANMDFHDAYVAAIERFSEPSYIDELLNAVGDELAENMRILHKEFPRYHFTKEIFSENQRYMRSFLNPVQGLNAYLSDRSGNKLELEIGNIQIMPLRISHVSYRDSLTFKPEEDILLPVRYFSDLVDYKKFSFVLPNDFAWADSMASDLKVVYHISGTTSQRSDVVYPWTRMDGEFLDNDFVRQKPNAGEHVFLTVDSERKMIDFKPGDWTISRNVVIPPGYHVAAGEGVRLDVIKSAKILSYSPISFVGTEENPVVVASSDSSGQGILVIGANERSLLEYAHFEGLTNPSQNGWAIPGAITFYDSDVTVRHCRFVSNRCEDALNIFGSEFAIESTVFDGNHADAFDGDFTKGAIRDTKFIRCGNDGVDVSGSIVEIENVFADGVGDKALSAGEASYVDVRNLRIQKAAIGVAAKDRSRVTINQLKIYDSDIGVTVFKKKSEFGPATISIRGITSRNVEMPYLVELESKLTVDGKRIESGAAKVESILYGAVYGKSSK